MIFSKKNIDQYKEKEEPVVVAPVAPEQPEAPEAEDQPIDLTPVVEQLNKIARSIGDIRGGEEAARELSRSIALSAAMVQQAFDAMKAREDRMAAVIGELTQAQKSSLATIKEMIAKPGKDYTEALKMIADNMGKPSGEEQWVHKVKYSTSGYIEEIISNKKTT